jgi:hypothetical protein
LGNDLNESQINSRYGALIKIIDEATNPKIIDMNMFITYAIRDWIFKVQSAFNRGEIRDAPSLMANAILDWQAHSRIFSLVAFSLNTGGFECRIKLKPSLDPNEREFTFDNLISAANFQLQR